MKKRDTRSVQERLTEIGGLRGIVFTNIASLFSAKDRVSAKCQVCGTEWETAAENLLRSGARASGCPTCAITAATKKRRAQGLEKFMALCTKTGYSLVGEYSGYFAPVTVSCPNGHRPFTLGANNFAAGQRCPECTGNRRHHRPEDVVSAYIAGTTWEATTPAVARKEMSFRCFRCAKEKTISWASILQGSNGSAERRDCDCRRYGRQFATLVASTHGEYEMVTPYRTSKEAVKMRHAKCRTEWSVLPYNFTRGTRCPTCARRGRSSTGQLEMAAFIRDELGLKIEENRTGLIPSRPRLEVDIYVPSASVAVEFDGVWWHAEGAARSRSGTQRPDASPERSVEKAIALDAEGVRLIRVFSDEWALRRPAVESRLRAILGRPTERLDARKLVVDPDVPLAEALAFLDSNHVQWRVSASSHVAVGLRDVAGALRAVMTFGERSTSGSARGVQLEMLRFCTVAGINVRGGAGRLLAAFLTHYRTDHATLVSYADVRWSGVRGAFYTALGFEATGRTRPSYAYVHPGQSNRRVSRVSMQKHKLLATHPEFDPAMTELQMAEALGFARVWDSGQLRYELRI